MPKPDPIPAKRPRGRPKGGLGLKAEARRMTAREYASTYVTDAIDVHAEIMKDSEAPPAARVSAANAILDRAIGRAVQSVELSGPDGGAIETVNLDKLAGLSDAALEEIARAEARANA